MSTIKQDELINLLKEIYEEQNETTTTKKETETWLKAVFSTVFEALELGYDVQVGKVGKFEQRVRKARKGRNPSTGEEIDIAEANAIGYKISKALKTAINTTE